MKKLNIKIFPEIENLKNQGKDDACLWEYIEKRNPEQKFSVPLIKKFVENDVCPDELAHLELDDKSLMALYQKNPQVCAEAAMTLTERKLRPAVSVRQFSNVFSKCCDDRIYAWLFRRMIYNPVYDEATTEKYRRAIDIIQKKYKPSPFCTASAYNACALKPRPSARTVRTRTSARDRRSGNGARGVGVHGGRAVGGVARSGQKAAREGRKAVHVSLRRHLFASDGDGKSGLRNRT